MTYRHRDGSFAGAVVIESNALINARMRVALSGTDKGLTFVSGDVLNDDSLAEMPVDLLGCLLDQSDLRKLERMLLKKKPPAEAARRAKQPL